MKADAPDQFSSEAPQTSSKRRPKAQDEQSPEYEIVDQDPGEQQKQNQNTEKDDPLAA